MDDPRNANRLADLPRWLMRSNLEKMYWMELWHFKLKRSDPVYRENFDFFHLFSSIMILQLMTLSSIVYSARPNGCRLKIIFVGSIAWFFANS